MAFQCIVLTPEQQLVNQLIEQAIVPAHDGLLGLLTGRAPIIVKLNPGPLRVDLGGGKSQFFFIDGGLAQMKQDQLTILTQRAIPASEIDVTEAQQEYDQAMQLTGTTPEVLAQKQKALETARAKLNVAAKKRPA
jgi:F-type H+-transporting ATPase subunit epsilon